MVSDLPNEIYAQIILHAVRGPDVTGIDFRTYDILCKVNKTLCQFAREGIIRGSAPGALMALVDVPWVVAGERLWPLRPKVHNMSLRPCRTTYISASLTRNLRAMDEANVLRFARANGRMGWVVVICCQELRADFLRRNCTLSAEQLSLVKSVLRIEDEFSSLELRAIRGIYARLSWAQRVMNGEKIEYERHDPSRREEVAEYLQKNHCALIRLFD